MYVVFEDGSRQYRVSEGDRVQIDLRKNTDGEPLPVGSDLELNRVLLYANGNEVQIGSPVVAGMRVMAKVIEHTSTKTYIQKFRRRKNYRRRTGHRQPFLKVQIAHILLPGMDAPTRQDPIVQAPATDAPTQQDPIVEAPKTETPATETANA